MKKDNEEIARIILSGLIFAKEQAAQEVGKINNYVNNALASALRTEAEAIGQYMSEMRLPFVTDTATYHVSSIEEEK